MTKTLTACGINRSLFVEARLWFDKSGGNTYFTARVFIDGKHAFTMPFQYGYDMQYLYEAGRELVKRGYLPAEYENKPLWRARDEFGFDFYHSDSYVLKRELFKEMN
jgi:hypothetical protein